MFPGNGNLTFGAPIISTTRPFKFKMADFNGDGLLDVGMILQQDVLRHGLDWDRSGEW